ncbi:MULTISPECIES: hypothetical protein [Lacticaseibacillus]|uniref:Uncharacterized protein n=2 Tax=Lacticaseibacillus TaxID=2759736 RepID=A0ABW4CEN9_9LACO
MIKITDVMALIMALFVNVALIASNKPIVFPPFMN